MTSKIFKTALPDLPLSEKLLYTGYLLTIGLGLLMAGAQILLTHGMADGKLGLSVDDIVYSYHGNRKGTTLEAKLNGSMKNNAPAPVRLEIIKWARKGAPESEWNDKIKPYFERYCVMCHNAQSALPDFTKLENIQKQAQPDQGVSFTALTRVSHIHLFGISFIFMLMGLIFVRAVGIPEIIKGLLLITPFAFLILDVISWWLTKIWPGFAWVTIIGGFGYTLASTYMLFTSLYQMWFLKSDSER
ncbi:elongation factor-1 alpha [methane-oxidizing endosymbiont of Gigantopelta aegis]|uniref:elongation factor-1 alpha n=1 Tax=methane-oxidizing endosymbiont of Gigantopelta aegis TaxID=2794938 RepID=UPI0018DC5A2D|nr:elongation factor-1 alpha [methane-oxidizing endosymbiont of Gigantopelta aegis]